MKQQEFKRANKLPILILALVSLNGLVAKVEARTRYMIAGHYPACSTCHKSTAKKGLVIVKERDEAGKLIYVGPDKSWLYETLDGESLPPVYAKMDRYCQKKYHNPDYIMLNYTIGQCGLSE